MPFDGAGFARADAPASVLIQQAIRRIRKPRNWGRGDDCGSVLCRRLCMLEALAAAAANDDWLPNEVEAAAYEALRQAVSARGFHYAMDFNDHPDTTHADVLAVMHEAAELAKVSA